MDIKFHASIFNSFFSKSAKNLKKTITLRFNFIHNYKIKFYEYRNLPFAN